MAFQFNFKIVERRVFQLVLAALVLGFCSFSHALVYVDGNRPAGGNGTSWASAFNTLEAAIAASGENQEFWVATATYAPAATLTVKSGSRFYGGFAGIESGLDQRNVAAYPTIVDGRNALNHVFLVNLLAAGVRIDGFTITRGAATPGAGWDAYGGGVFVDQQAIVIANCVFTANTAAVQGGAVFVNRAPATIENCIFQSNTSVEAGGAFSGFVGPVTIIGSSFLSNQTQQYGGAVYTDGGPVYNELTPVSISGCLFQGNVSSTTGGAISANRAPVTVQGSNFRSNHSNIGAAIASFDVGLTTMDCVFEANSADIGSQPRGGAIWHNLHDPRILYCTFSGNSALWTGGAVELNNTLNAQVVGCQFLNNTAGQGGGGLSAQWDQVSTPGAAVTVEQCLFRENTSSLEGGGIYSYLVHFVIRETDFLGNSAANGGGLMLDYRLPTTTQLERCKFLGNRATIIGGALRSYARRVNVENSVFAYNTAPNAGAVGIHAGDGVDFDSGLTVNLANSSFYGNAAVEFGGAMLNTNVPMVNLNNSIFWGNQAGSLVQNGTVNRTTPDVSNTNTTAMTIRYTNMESLEWVHQSVSETHVGSFSADPRFADPDGADNIAATMDDDFRLLPDSPCIDRADGSLAPVLDMDLNGREDQPAIPNAGSGTINYADVGPYEMNLLSPVPPSAPHLTATHIGTTVILSWSPVVNAAGYTVYFAPVDLSFIGNAPLGTLTNISFDLFSGAAFYIAVMANGNGGSSGISNVGFFSIP